MENILTVDLVPTKRLMRTIKKVGIYANFVPVVLFSVVFIPDWETGFLGSLPYLLVTLPLLLPGLIFDRVSQSVVRFDTSQIQVLDKRGTC